MSVGCGAGKWCYIHRLRRLADDITQHITQTEHANKTALRTQRNRRDIFLDE